MLDLKRYRFTVTEYNRIGEAGILGEDARVELIDGEIIEMSPIGPHHASNVDRLTDLFVPRVRSVAIVRVQSPIQLGEHGEPEPDLTLLRRRADYYASGHPTAADVLLVVEIADSSIEYDRQIKAPLYARHGIPEYWLVDLARDHLTVYRDPTTDGYAAVRVLRRGERVSPLAFPDLSLNVAEILG